MFFVNQLTIYDIFRFSVFSEGFEWVGTTQMGPNDMSHVVWALGMCIVCVFLLISHFFVY